jgi:DNA-binding NarL/FixJ family response regulator
MNPIRVMLVDASDRVLRVVAQLLEQHEDLAVVGSARSGREALSLARQLKPDVILLDLEMPDRAGLEVLPKLPASLPATGIVALTLYDVKAYRKWALANGADEFAPKERLLTDLLPAIRRIVHVDGRRS